MNVHFSFAQFRNGLMISTLVCCALFAGCATQQQTFDSPEQAVEAMVAALRPEVNRDRMEEIFGDDIHEALTTGDDVADRQELDNFLERYDRAHRLAVQEDGSRILEIDDDRWPFAFPLVEDDGRWRFDTEAGIEELINRRVGANELDTIQTCLAIVDAQREYAMLDPDKDGRREYAAKFISDRGTKNGLFWPTTGNERPSPLGDLIGVAAEEGYERNDPYHGYYFKLLDAQGPGAPGGAVNYSFNGELVAGFGVIAWPATYGVSGVKTFLTNQLGVVYERDLGDNTANIVRSTNAFDPSGWDVVTIETEE